MAARTFSSLQYFSSVRRTRARPFVDFLDQAQTAAAAATVVVVVAEAVAVAAAVVVFVVVDSLIAFGLMGLPAEIDYAPAEFAVAWLTVCAMIDVRSYLIR